MSEWLDYLKAKKTTHTAKKKYTYPNFCIWKNNEQSTKCHTKFFVLQVYTCLWTYSISLNLRQQQHDAIKSKNNTARTTKARTSVHSHGTRQMCTVYRDGFGRRWGGDWGTGGWRVEEYLRDFSDTEYWLFNLTLKGSERPASGMVGSVFFFWVLQWKRTIYRCAVCLLLMHYLPLFSSVYYCTSSLI
jgi:hypothetical protein